jgi:hypothetical protein
MNLANLDRKEILKHYPYVAVLDKPGANVDHIGGVYASVIGFAAPKRGPTPGQTIKPASSPKMIVPRRAFILHEATTDVGWGKSDASIKTPAAGVQNPDQTIGPL